MKFSEKIIKIRKENGLSQEEFGNKINVSRQAISKWESEQSQPEVEKIKEISKIFEVSIEYLLNDELKEDIKITERKDKKTTKSIAFKILIAIVIVYVVFCLFKFALLSICYIRANNIADYDNYSIAMSLSFDDILLDEHYESSEVYTYKKGIQQIELYDSENNFAQQITYINPNENKAYILNYNEEIKKYVYEDLKNNEEFSYEEYENNKFTLRNITLDSIPNILIASIDPRVTVFVDDSFFNINAWMKIGVKSTVSINKETGIFSEESVGSKISNRYRRIDFWIEDLVEEIDKAEPIEYENYIAIDELEEI